MLEFSGVFVYPASLKLCGEILLQYPTHQSKTRTLTGCPMKLPVNQK
jgi:hypothetical protein